MLKRPTFLTAAAALLAAAPAHNPAAAQDRPALTVYTYDSFVSEWGPGPAIEEAFETGCGCDLEMIGVEDGVALLSRLRLEGGGSNADVVVGLDTNLIADAKETGLFAPHGLEPPETDVPGGWNDPIFVPYDWSYFAFVYDTEAMETPPASLKELVEESEAEILIQDPRTSTPGLGLLLWVKKIYGDEAADAWAQISPRIVTVSAGWSESYGLFQEGEAPMVLSYTTSPAYHILMEETDRYQAAAFEEGHYLQIEVAGRMAGSDQPELAKEFLAFLIGPEAQSILPTTNWMYPAVMPEDGLPDAFDTAVEPETALLFTPEEVAANRSDWVDEWLRALSR